jgi:hypothetical protein
MALPMNFSRQQISTLLLSVSLIAAAWLNACDSPLDVETPRNSYSDQVSVLPGEDIGTAVSIVLPPDSTGVDTVWTPAHFSIALVFDASGSISSQLNQYFINAGNTFLDSLDGVIDEGAIVFFNQTATVFQHVTTDVQAMRSAVRSLPMTGATAMWDGMYLAMLELQSKSTHMRKAVVIITDSDDNASRQGSPAKINDLGNRSDIAVFTIALHISSHELILRNIAQTTGGLHFSQPGVSELNGIMKKIASILRKP